MKRVSLIAALGALCYLAVLPVTAAVAAPAASSAATTYQGSPGSAARLTQAATVSSFPKVSSAFQNEGPQAFTPFRSPGGNDPAAASKTAQAPVMSANASVSATASPASTSAGSGSRVTHNFNGVSNLDSDNLNGFAITPPDQGLCVGRDNTLSSHPNAVWEPVNLAARETTANGTPLRPDVNLATLFQDPFAEGDVRCLYDPGTQTFFFTEIGFPVATGPASDDNNTTADVVVMNARGAAAYQFDTSLGGPSAGDCFGDQPKTGFDNNALVISTDEYCGPTETNYEGAIVLAISKSQLVHEAATVNDSVLGPVALQGNPVVGLDPAINAGGGTSYFVNSVPFLANGDNNPVGKTLGVWTLRNDASVTTGHGSPVLHGTAIRSQPYAFPVPATSTGDGSTTTVNGSVITSEAALNPDDSRMSGPVEVTRGAGGVQLTTALDAAVTAKGSTTDAAAWFTVSPAFKRVVKQGYVIAKGANLLYPAIQPRQFGPSEMVFTITSATINPSAAFATVGSGKITTVADGAGPHVSFSDAPPFNEPRWGDYSFVALDPTGSGIWLATEYIPPTASQDPMDNWGTYVFEVSGH
jgi:hypothetical protein